MLGRSNKVLKIERITIILAIELCAMNDRSSTIPTNVNAEAKSDNIEKKYSSKRFIYFKPSHSWPGAGIARKTKIISAVPITVFFCEVDIYLIKFFIRNSIIAAEPTKTIS